MHTLLTWLLGSVAVVLWYGLGRICLAYAVGTSMECYGEWDNSFAVCLWPLFLFAMIGEWLGDAGRRRLEARVRRKALEDAEFARAMREIERPGE